MATALDLEIVHREDGDWFRFTWTASNEEWHGALARIKAEIPIEFREYDPGEKVWLVAAEFECTLGDIFLNFDGALDGVRSQLNLF